jgi:hypothetical protein
MATKASIIFLFFVFILLSGYPQSKKELRNEKARRDYNETLELIKSGEFVFEADYVNTSLLVQKNLISPPNTLEVRNDSVFCELPFFGRAYYINPTEPGGFHFEEPIFEKKLTLNDRKMRITLTFQARKPNDWFQCTMIVTGSKNATLTVNSQNRETLSFWGMIYKR